MEELNKETKYIVGEEYLYNNRIIKLIISPKVLLGIVGNSCSGCVFDTDDLADCFAVPCDVDLGFRAKHIWIEVK